VRENLRLLAELRSRYRSADRGGPNGRQVRCPEDVADLLAPEMSALPQEQLRVVLLDARNRVLDEAPYSRAFLFAGRLSKCASASNAAYL
jgi:DNA repair protein RadC